MFLELLFLISLKRGLVLYHHRLALKWYLKS